jgi:hypothetical protein
VWRAEAQNSKTIRRVPLQSYVIGRVLANAELASRSSEHTDRADLCRMIERLCGVRTATSNWTHMTCRERYLGATSRNALPSQLSSRGMCGFWEMPSLVEIGNRFFSMLLLRVESVMSCRIDQGSSHLLLGKRWPALQRSKSIEAVARSTGHLRGTTK